MWEEGKGGTGRYREVQGGRELESKGGKGGIGMKSLYVVIFTFVLSLLLTLGINRPASAAPRHYTDIEFPSLPEVKLPNFTRYQLPNGLLVYLVEDHELPFISGTALIRVGDRWEPADQVGLGELTGTVLRTGGTKQRTGDEINQLLEQAAASVETGVSAESGSGGFSSLTEDVDQVFSLFAEVLTQPVFNQEKLDFAKSQIRGGITRRNDNPEGIMGREFTKLIYGADSPYARSTEYATLDRIDRPDRKSTRLNSSHLDLSRMPSSA